MDISSPTPRCVSRHAGGRLNGRPLGAADRRAGDRKPDHFPPRLPVVHVSCRTVVDPEMARMSRPRRERSTPYRVYSKEEFLAGADALTPAEVASAAWRDDTQPVGLPRGGEDRRDQRASGKHVHLPDQLADRFGSSYRYRCVRSRVVVVAVMASTLGVVGALIATVMRPARAEQLSRYIGFAQVSPKQPPGSVAIVRRPRHAGLRPTAGNHVNGAPPQRRAAKAVPQRSTWIHPLAPTRGSVDTTAPNGGQPGPRADAGAASSGRNGDFGFER